MPYDMTNLPNINHNKNTTISCFIDERDGDILITDSEGNTICYINTSNTQSMLNDIARALMTVQLKGFQQGKESIRIALGI